MPAGQRRLSRGSATEGSLITWARRCWVRRKEKATAQIMAQWEGVRNDWSLGEAAKMRAEI